MNQITTDPGITVRQRISVKQTAKGEFQRDYTVEITGPLDSVDLGALGPDMIFLTDEGDPLPLNVLNRIALHRAEADWSAHVERIKAGASDEQ